MAFNGPIHESLTALKVIIFESRLNRDTFHISVHLLLQAVILQNIDSGVLPICQKAKILVSLRPH